jgi:hypothetical protein
MCVFVFSTVVLTYFSFQNKRKDMWSKIYIDLHVKYPIFLSELNGTWIFLADFRKNMQTYNGKKIRPVWAQLFHTCKHRDRQMDGHDEANRRFFFLTFMWPCIVTIFFLIEPTDALIFQIYFCEETLRVSGSSSAHHQEFFFCTFGTGIRHAVLITAFMNDQDGRSWLMHDIYQCRLYNGKLLMMGGGTARNM